MLKAPGAVMIFFVSEELQAGHFWSERINSGL
jgi:hypothetical protein